MTPLFRAWWKLPEFSRIRHNVARPVGVAQQLRRIPGERRLVLRKGALHEIVVLMRLRPW
ncbi:MAG: hypothetical protein ACO3DQ_05760 [Cephaloticoccus sp.]